MAEPIKRELFQKKALDRLRSPDELDKLFAVTTPVGWIALLTVLILIASALVWSVFGVMADKVSGTGLIVDSAGMVNISPATGGRVAELRQEVGDLVQKGQVVAVVEQYSTEQDIARLKAELNNTTSQVEMSSKVAQLNALTDKLQRDGQVISPYTGVVAEKKVNVGDIVTTGTPLASLRLSPERGEIKVLLYVPILDGKKIRPGMTVQISTGTVSSTAYGYLIGKVSSVSAYPVSAEGINSWIGSKETTNWILQRNGGAAMEVHVALIKDPDTATGFLWSSISGAPDKISAGTACTGSIVVKRQAPLAKVFQNLNQWLRSD
ncbi:MAG TPA: NHLP bacteriocin system secretion protein [Negativicutes bacterium]|jgi:multidrug resistance efflux pump|nr:HlyD family secretion protein [Bacillota bacterium]HWR28997.1 NHLP bacteriocin system secretion protein [Negativicutes bacterium]